MTSHAITVEHAIGRARRLAAGDRRCLLGIAGPPGAGKSTLAATIAHAIGPDAVVVPMDGFHLADRVLAAHGTLSVKGRIDTFDADGFVHLVARLADTPGRAVVAPMFERDLEQPIAGAIEVLPRHRLVVVEGNYLLADEPPWPCLLAHFDEVWYCEAEPARRRARLVARHERHGKPAALAEAWVTDVDEPNAAVVERTRPRASVVVRT